MRKRNIRYVSTLYQEHKLKRKEEAAQFWADDGEENCLLNIYPSVKYQVFEGFGGALTESAGYIYNQMGEAQKEEMIRTYFGAEEMGYRMVRIPIDSCDFSLGHYEAVSDAEDRTFEHFQLERVEKNILPLLEDAQRIYGTELEIMLTP